MKMLSIKRDSRFLIAFTIATILFLFIVLIFIGTHFVGWMWPNELFSAILGAVIVTIITYLLIGQQAKKESDVARRKRVFDNRVKAYESFLDNLRDVVVKNEVTLKDEKLLQFGVATIGMHTTSDRMFRLSKNLKRIVQKIRVDSPIDGSMWNEVMDIVEMFHTSLYEEEAKERDNDMKKAIRNFRGLCVNEKHKVLEYLECMLSPFDFDTHIADKCLYVNIHIREDKYERLQKLSEYYDDTPKRLYVTLSIDECTGEKHNGSIAVYTGKDAIKQKKMIDTIYDNFWILPPNRDATEDKKNIKNIEMGVMKISYAYTIKIEDKTKEEIYSNIIDVLRYIDELWDEPDKQYLLLCKDRKTNIWIPKKRNLADYGSNQ